MRFLLIDKVHPILIEKLAHVGIQCDYFENLTYQKALEIIASYEGIVVRSKFPVDKTLIDKATKLKIIGRVGSGMENIDVAEAERRNIICLNSPEGNRNAVAEHAVGLLLNLFNNITKANYEVKQSIWLREANRGIELKGKTVGIIGFGNTGSQFAQKLTSFECTILAYDKYKSGFSKDYIKEASLHEIQKNADIISFHVPLTSETQYYLNKEFIQSCSKSFYLINTSRGKVVNTVDLLEGLKSGKILGAGLDVIEYEDISFETPSFPPIFYELINLPNVIITPHIAGWTKESKVLLSEILADKIIQHIRNVSRK